MNEEKIRQLNSMLKKSRNVVFFGGAGVSTESGIPDFRSQDGLYSIKYSYPPERILSHSFFLSNTGDFYDFYRNKMLFPDAKPNSAHIKLAKLEKEGIVQAVITQNIDGLHQAAGSVNVLELHGSVHRNYCVECEMFYGLDAVMNSCGIPRCECGAIIKPDVVLYEESLDNTMMNRAANYISQADMLIVGGTSLVVYPAAGLINYFTGNKLVVINKSDTALTRSASLFINAGICEVLN